MLEINNLNVSYGDVRVLFDITAKVDKAQLVSIVGANAAGKSTLLRAVSGLLKKTSGSILFNGEELIGKPAFEIVDRGIVHIPQGRRVFPAMSVQENLEMGFYSQRTKGKLGELSSQMYALFPELSNRKHQLAGRLSGGEQQMLAIARGLIACPILLTVDEPSLGLAPILVEKTFHVIEKIKQEKVTILLVEQNVYKALNLSDHAYVIENGRIVLEGLGRNLLQDEHLKNAYLGAVTKPR